MRLRSIRTEDIVKCDVRGDVFHAIVTRAAVAGELRVRPLQRGVSWRHVTARQVIGHWRHATLGDRGGS